MAELVDALVSGTSNSDVVQVRVLSGALELRERGQILASLFFCVFFCGVGVMCYILFFISLVMRTNFTYRIYENSFIFMCCCAERGGDGLQ